MNPLATDDQRDIETLALRITEAPAVRAAREQARRTLLVDPVIASESGRAGLERALDQWTLALAMREANGDPARPKIVWSVDNTPRQWFGHIYPGAAVAVDNPDRTSNFSLKLEEEPADHAGMGQHLFMLLTENIHTDADGHFRITLSRESAEGRANHIQIGPGRQSLYARDSFGDWTQSATDLAIRRTGGAAPPPPRGEEAITATVAEYLPAFVGFWAGFKEGFYGNPEPNRIVGPIGREASWGFLAGGRFNLADDEALVINTASGGARYTGFQVADPWTIAPDPLYRQSSLNSSQIAANPDGSFTYVLSLRDPGIHNWIDPVGLHQGWFNLRWQGFPGGHNGEGLVRDCTLVKLDGLERHLPAGCPRVDLAGRRAQIAPRAALYRLRHATH